MISPREKKNTAIIAFQARAGKILQEKHPEIRDEYLNGRTQQQIAKRHSVAGMFEIHGENPDEIARLIVLYSLSGCKSDDPRINYPGLLTQEEARKTGRAHTNKTLATNRKNQGMIEWTKGEKLYAHFLETTREYSLKEIAKSVNELHHSGESIRNTEATKQMLYLIRKRLRGIHPSIVRTLEYI